MDAETLTTIALVALAAAVVLALLVVVAVLRSRRAEPKAQAPKRAAAQSRVVERLGMAPLVESAQAAPVVVERVASAVPVAVESVVATPVVNIVVPAEPVSKRVVPSGLAARLQARHQTHQADVTAVLPEPLRGEVAQALSRSDEATRTDVSEAVQAVAATEASARPTVATFVETLVRSYAALEAREEEIKQAKQQLRDLRESFLRSVEQSFEPLGVGNSIAAPQAWGGRDLEQKQAMKAVRTMRAAGLETNAIAARLDMSETELELLEAISS